MPYYTVRASRDRMCMRSYIARCGFPYNCARHLVAHVLASGGGVAVGVPYPYVDFLTSRSLASSPITEAERRDIRDTIAVTLLEYRGFAPNIP